MKLNDLVESVRKEIKMGKSWKTTLSGIIAAAGPILLALGIPQEVAAAITTIGLFMIGLFAKDSNVTGGTVQ